ncbi:MAG: hypothetical protein K6T73_05320 [Candidatus Bathyarchaeota archaeon]|nr:hypothetical protein [Candidatus Bathyarchaeota archaeon]
MLYIKPVFVFGKYPRFIKPDYSGFERNVNEKFITKKAKELELQLRQYLENADTKLLEPTIVFSEEDLDDALRCSSDVIIICKFCLGLTKSLEKLLNLHVPILLFEEPRVPYLALDAYEYLHDKGNVQVVLDYEDLKAKIKVHGLRESLRNNKILALSTDLPAYEQVAALRNPTPEQIMERFGVQVEHVKHAELVEKWSQIPEEAAVSLAKKWLREAYRIVEPCENDLTFEARLYLAIKKLVKESSASAVTMVCSDQIAPLPAECFAFAKLRDEGVPAGCEADLTSLLMLLLVQKLCQRPAFMGNVLVVNPEEETVAISHCVMPFKMAGFDAEPKRYELRDYHGLKFSGSLTAYYPLENGQIVTLARMDRNLTSIYVKTGVIVDCKEGFDCRTTLIVKISNVREYVNKTSGNHQIVVFGDWIKELEDASKIFGMRFIK